MSFPEKPSDHVPGAGAGEPEGRAGDQEREAAPAGREADENGEAGTFLSAPPPRAWRLGREPGCDLEPGAVVTAPEAIWKYSKGKRGSVSLSVLAPGWPLLPSATLPPPHPKEQVKQQGVLGKPTPTPTEPAPLQGSVHLVLRGRDFQISTLMFLLLWAGFGCPKELDVGISHSGAVESGYRSSSSSFL